MTERAESTGRASAPQQPLRLVVDAHVHLYPCHDLRLFLDSAVENLLSLAGAGAGGRPEVLPCLLMTESAQDFAFRGLRDGAIALPARWVRSDSPCDLSLRLRRTDGHELFIVAGRQVATVERLEVLALAADAVVPDRLPFDETIERVRDTGAFPAIPWGFGKWWGGRGRIVAAALERESPSSLALGDNGGRLELAAEPALFEQARRRGFRILPGTDPLPFASQARRVGSYGFMLELAAGVSVDARAIRDSLALMSTNVAQLGRRTAVAAFAVAQARMQIRSRL